MTRRDALTGLGVGLSAVAMPSACAEQEGTKSQEVPAFSFCLNASTIRGQKLGIWRELEIAAEAGYDGMEIWVPSLQQYMEEGGKLSDLKMMVQDKGLTLDDAIGFAQWIVDDDDVRAAALDQLKREMDMLAQVGCHRIAAPPAGAVEEAGLDLDRAAERYHAILELGKETGVMPQLEVWGFSANLHKISQVLYVMAECGHPDAKVLPDVYHLFKGGSDFDALKLIDGDRIEIFHMNDYPAAPVRQEMDDSHRVYPGDGVAPIGQVLRDLKHTGQTTILSLELFNRDYWEQDPLEVAKTGLAKMKAAVASM